MNKNASKQINKSRFGRVSTKRKFSEQFISSSTCIPKDNYIIKKKKKQICSSKSGQFSDKNHLLLSNYCIGDIVWAKMGKYPVWPGIIVNDPDENIFFKKNSTLMLHLYFCNDLQKRSWIKENQIFEFAGRKKVVTQFPKLITQISRSKLKIKWNKAVDEAESLAVITKNDRIKAYFDNTILPMNSDKTTKKLQKKNRELKNSPKTQRTKICSFHIQKNNENEHPRILIPELCKQFYISGWVTGTGGGISIKYNGHIYIAPSGVQKERIQSEDIFVQDMNGIDLEVPPKEKLLNKSQCTPIFICVYNERNAGAVIHTHSPEVVKLSLLNPENEVRIKGLEMIKGIFNDELDRFYNNDEDVIVPIIENSKFERDLVHTFHKTLKKYPASSAILVRNHGMYVWGKDWKSAKTQCECYDYCFNILIFQKTHLIQISEHNK
ncbi:uncharacterized protein LOC126901982 isoform X2 [Daktulosphaira vitifoliae]|uniref:uncharacterized protein LOC126901982 isoform X2 n=1 Tax=Daktulosphaira vitifoliae TaxID=58002 RepID=UPI0021AAA4F5|nr:uncharacterized protein LOC126901982 isoform X2 [Daktulosphaira vitifoliae]